MKNLKSNLSPLAGWNGVEGGCCELKAGRDIFAAALFRVVPLAASKAVAVGETP